jgi:hypothetical protein
MMIAVRHAESATLSDKKDLSIGGSAFAKRSDDSCEDDASVSPEDLSVPILRSKDT